MRGTNFECMGCGQPGQMLAGEVYQRTPQDQEQQDAAEKITGLLMMPRTVLDRICTALVGLAVPAAIAVGVVALLRKRGKR